MLRKHYGGIGSTSHGAQDPIGTVLPVMFLMFVIWGVAYVGVFLHKRWTIPVALVALVYTLAMLRVHMTDTIPLNF